MPYDFPERLTLHADEDEKRLWECLWKLVERLNLNEESLSAKLERLEENDGISKT